MADVVCIVVVAITFITLVLHNGAATALLPFHLVLGPFSNHRNLPKQPQREKERKLSICHYDSVLRIIPGSLLFASD